jgi:hypothetical protein
MSIQSAIHLLVAALQKNINNDRLSRLIATSIMELLVRREAGEREIGDDEWDNMDPRNIE